LGNAYEKIKHLEIIKRSEKLHKTLTENLPNGMIFLIDPQLKISFVAGTDLKKLQLTSEELVNQYLSDWVDKGDKEYISGGLKKVFEGHCLSFVINRKSEIYQVNCLPLFEDGDKVNQVIAFANNVTVIKRVEEEVKTALIHKEFLIREIYHRVKNNLAMVEGILFLQKSVIEDPAMKGILDDCAQRIHSMALVHSDLYQSDNLDKISLKEYMDHLLSHIISSYSFKDNIKIEIDIDDIFIDFNKVISLGLICNELVTNSFKYAFPSTPKGIIKIQIKKQYFGNELLIKDTGIGFPDNYQDKKSLGLKLVNMMVSDLNGTIFFNNNNGAEVKVLF
jgi:two-component sensor histidine kinase